MTINTVIFDFGNVLLDWNPRYVYSEIFEDEQEMEAFLESRMILSRVQECSG